MNKKLRITLDVLLILVGLVLFIFGVKDAITLYNKSKVTDNLIFYKSYRDVGKENIFKYTSSKEINKILKEGNGIIIIGKTTDPWMQVFVKPFHDYVKDYTDTIYYLELDKIDKEDKEYKKLVKSLDEVSSLEVVIVKNGKVITKLYKDDIIDSEFDGAPIEYFDDERVENLKTMLAKVSELK